MLPLRVLQLGDATCSNLKFEIDRALSEFTSLGRSIPASEWKEINALFLQEIHLDSTKEFERKKREVTIRENLELGNFTILGSGKGLDNLEHVLASIDEVAFSVHELLLAKKSFRIPI